MNKPLLAVWLDQNKKIVDKKVALPWRLYTPGERSKYLLETSPTEYNFCDIGEIIEVYEI